MGRNYSRNRRGNQGISKAVLILGAVLLFGSVIVVGASSYTTGMADRSGQISVGDDRDSAVVGLEIRDDDLNDRGNNRNGQYFLTLTNQYSSTVTYEIELVDDEISLSDGDQEEITLNPGESEDIEVDVEQGIGEDIDTADFTIDAESNSGVFNAYLEREGPEVGGGGQGGGNN